MKTVWIVLLALVAFFAYTAFTQDTVEKAKPTKEQLSRQIVIPAKTLTDFTPVVLVLDFNNSRVVYQISKGTTDGDVFTPVESETFVITDDDWNTILASKQYSNFMKFVNAQLKQANKL